VTVLNGLLNGLEQTSPSFKSNPWQTAQDLENSFGFYKSNFAILFKTTKICLIFRFLRINLTQYSSEEGICLKNEKKKNQKG